jgi:predicted AAA+ superfamily ATPase
MFNRWIDIKSKNFLLLGPRRAGKTTFLRKKYSNFKYVTLDDFDILAFAKSDPKGLIQSLLPNAIIDEIQRAPQLTIAIKQFIDQDSINVVMTGSSSIGLLDSSADSLAGRIDILSLPPACWGEECGEVTHKFFDEQVTPIKIAEAQRQFELVLKFGGFPEVVSEPSTENKEIILKRYRDTYFTRDLAQLSNIENVEGLLAILQHTSRSIGSHLEISSFATESGLSHPTAKKYINTLTQSQLAFKIYGYHFGPAKRYLKAAKLYFCDNSLLTALNSQVTRGQAVENFVISELEKRRKLGFIKTEQFFYYKSTSGAEIDLMFEVGSDLYAIEIKASRNISNKDLRNLRQYKASSNHKSLRCFLIYLGTEYKNVEDIQCLPIYALFRGI